MQFTMPDGCMGLKLQDGTRYGSVPGQTVEVTRPDHIDAIKQSPNAGYIGNGRVSVTLADLVPDRWCACGHNALPWTVVCPRCGRELSIRD